MAERVSLSQKLQRYSRQTRYCVDQVQNCDIHGKDWEVLKPRLEKSNNGEYWISKISRNRERDDEINKKLLFEGWTVIRFWGNDIKKNTDECVRVVEETVFDVMTNV